MTDSHPINPPPELMKKWVAMLKYCEDIDVFTDVARWGADQELKACCEWIDGFADVGEVLREERRPKLQSLKDQALTALRTIETNIPQSLQAFEDSCEDIRRALEALPDD